MLFNSFDFICLLGITLGLYYLPKARLFQVQILIGASFVFYAWEAPVLLMLLVACIVLNAFISYGMSWTDDTAGARKLAVCGVFFNIGLLVFFKYGPLAAHLLPKSDDGIADWLIAIPLPIGISFYTFENISLLVDVLRHRERGLPAFVPRRLSTHLWHSSLFVAFFPHLVSGPILKADTFIPQIGGGRRWRDIPWGFVFKSVVAGFFLKTVVADNLKEVTSLMTYPQFVGYSSWTLLALLFGYSAQIFADFAGYSLIAIGLAALFGYKLPDNFNYPYIAASLGEFWRRWHISLSSWLRDYLYFPLGGNRRGRFRTYLNLFLVMAIGGLWHGAAWSFAIWGLYHGLGLAVERWVAERWPSLGTLVPRWLGVMLAVSFVSLGWLLFRLPDFEHVLVYIRCIAENWGLGLGGQKRLWIYLFVFCLPVVLMHAWAAGALGGSAKGRAPRIGDWVLYGFLGFCILASSGLPGSFIYFQF